jgi:high-affinity Fe2+/Pb2+ permease
MPSAGGATFTSVELTKFGVSALITAALPGCLFATTRAQSVDSSFKYIVTIVTLVVAALLSMSYRIVAAGKYEKLLRTRKVLSLKSDEARAVATAAIGRDSADYSLTIVNAVFLCALYLTCGWAFQNLAIVANYMLGTFFAVAGTWLLC